MTPQDFERFQTSTQDCGVLFYYAGEFTPTMIAAAADTLKGRLASEEAGSAAKRKVFSTFIEMAQNVLHYAAAHAEPGQPQPPASGAIAVGRDASEGDAGLYWLVCSNPVHVEHIALRGSDPCGFLTAMLLDHQPVVKQLIDRPGRHNAENATHEWSTESGCVWKLLAVTTACWPEQRFQAGPKNRRQSTNFP